MLDAASCPGDANVHPAVFARPGRRPKTGSWRAFCVNGTPNLFRQPVVGPLMRI